MEWRLDYSEPLFWAEGLICGWWAESFKIDVRITVEKAGGVLQSGLSG